MTKILIVEDDENIAKTIKATVSMVGYTAEICSDGGDAVELIKNGVGYVFSVFYIMGCGWCIHL